MRHQACIPLLFVNPRLIAPLHDPQELVVPIRESGRPREALQIFTYQPPDETVHFGAGVDVRASAMLLAKDDPRCLSRRRLTTLALTATFTAAGCSAIFVDKLPEQSSVAATSTECTDSRVAPWVDTGLSALFLATIPAVFLTPCEPELGCIHYLGLLATVPLGAGLGASAIWGHSSVSQCQALGARH
jgi:hypothetical protein